VNTAVCIQVGEGRQRAVLATAGMGELEIASHHLETRIQELDAVEERLELRRLVLHVHGVVTLPQSCSSAAIRSS
jgi:hypothetical protein